ncbi:hypothetical protein MHBO_002979 [Bonamia ostreae]|uniref:Uncharacterized protein n=1 Tax=Bonamia ostreae TaxID=126728 RepID=A0ABV2AP39_9EUKA
MNIRAIMPTEALMVFAAELPSSEVAMSTVNQVGYSRFRSRFLAVIKNFAFQYNLKLNENTISRKCPLSLKRLLLPHSCSVIRDLS